jgi:hypothetical protein
VIDNYVSRENAIGVRHQIFQQTIFLRRELDPFSGPAHLLRQPV